MRGAFAGRPRGQLRGCCESGRIVGVLGVTPTKDPEGSIIEPEVHCLSVMLVNQVLLNIEI